jgi:transcription elongation factor GreA
LSDIESDGRTVISCTSPVGRAMIGRCVGDTCIVKLPSGEKEYEILEVTFKE